MTRRRRSSGAVVTAEVLELIIEDTFTAANGTNPDGRTPAPSSIGSTWARPRGTWSISSNKLTTSGIGNTLAIEAGANDFTVEVDITTAAAVDADLGVYVITHNQSNNDTTGCLVGYDSNGSYRCGNGGVDVTPVLETVAATLSPNTTYHWKIVCVGSSLKFYVDGVLKLSTVLASTTLGNRVALSIFGNNNRPTFDNFQVYAPTSAPTIIAHDTFTASDGTVLEGRTLSPVAATGTWDDVKFPTTIVSNKAKSPVAGAADDNETFVNVGVAAYTLVCKVARSSVAGSYAGIVFRAVGTAGNFEYIYLSNATTWILGKAGTGGVATYATAAGTFTADVEYELKIVVSGKLIRAYIDGVRVATVLSTSGYDANTRVGLLGLRSSTFDDFKVSV